VAFQRWGDTRAAAGKSRHETSKKGTALQALTRPNAKQQMYRDEARGVAVAALGGGRGGLQQQTQTCIALSLSLSVSFSRRKRLFGRVLSW